MRKSILRSLSPPLLLSLAITGGSVAAAMGGETEEAKSAASTLSPGIDPLALFQRLDSNGDGQLAADEIPTDKRSHFERLVRLGDGDADGILSADEFAAGLTGGKQQLEAPPKPGAAKQPAKTRPGRPGKAARPEPGRLFAVLDANGDGMVSRDEIPENRRPRIEKLIDRADRDGDQALSLAEFRRELRMRMASSATIKPAEQKPQAKADAPKKAKPKKAKPKKVTKKITKKDPP